jgi:glutathione synthase/RimK-type ligase-like ATP-grasp enzyme
MIAIHIKGGSYSDKWVEYCKSNSVKYKLVNAFDSDIIEQLKGCDGFMWHWQHNDHIAQLFARQLIRSVEKMGVKVFPDSKTSWHYDDKIGQKYLLEAVDAPLVPTYVFYNKQQAINWSEHTTFPKVQKLRKGAGSQNVKFINTIEEAYKIISKAFHNGISSYSKFTTLQENIWRFRRDKSLRSFFRIGKYIGKLFLPDKYQPSYTNEKGYIYFQNFIPNNTFDIRVVVIGNRAVAFKRFTREGDFRASGSGNYDTNPEQIPINCIKASFEVSYKLDAQCLAYDFIMEEGEALIVEVSYAFGNKVPPQCPGYWNSDLTWHERKVVTEQFMIEDFLNEIKQTSRLK